MGDGSSRKRGKDNAFGLTDAQVQTLIRLMTKRIHQGGISGHVQLHDVLHDAFVAALSKPISERPDPKDWNHFCGWMSKIAHLCALKTFQSKHTRTYRSVVPEEDFPEIEDENCPSRIVEEQPALRMAYQRLPPHQKEVIREHLLEEKALRFLSTERGVHLTTLANRYHRALDQMRCSIQAIERPRRRGFRPLGLFPIPLLLFVAAEARALVRGFVSWAILRFKAAPRARLSGAACGLAVVASSHFPVCHATDSVTRTSAQGREIIQNVRQTTLEWRALPPPKVPGVPPRAPKRPAERYDTVRPLEWLTDNSARRPR